MPSVVENASGRAVLRTHSVSEGEDAKLLSADLPKIRNLKCARACSWLEFRNMVVVRVAGAPSTLPRQCGLPSQHICALIGRGWTQLNATPHRPSAAPAHLRHRTGGRIHRSRSAPREEDLSRLSTDYTRRPRHARCCCRVQHGIPTIPWPFASGRQRGQHK